MEFGSSGILIGKPLERFQGILTGVPTFIGEEQEEILGLGIEETTARLDAGGGKTGKPNAPGEQPSKGTG
jgi:hypothetical protein